MKIAIVHSSYRSGSSGENAVVEASIRTLEEAGHQVKLISKDSKLVQQSLASSLRAGARVASRRGQSPLEEIKGFKPDVVHVHNLFPNWSEAWIQKLDTPLVATLHNFRRLCAAGTLNLGGTHCTLCPRLGSQNAILNRCYRDSRLKSVPLAIATANPSSDRLLSRANRVIFITDQARKARAPFVSPNVLEKSVVIPNAIEDPRSTSQEEYQQQTASDRARRPWLYLGRLSSEKGILELLANWPKEAELVVAGDGPP